MRAILLSIASGAAVAVLVVVGRGSSSSGGGLSLFARQEPRQAVLGVALSDGSGDAIQVDGQDHHRQPASNPRPRSSVAMAEVT